MMILQVESKIKHSHSIVLFKSRDLLFHNWTAFSEETNRALGALFLTNPSKYEIQNGDVRLSHRKLRQGPGTKMFYWDMGSISGKCRIKAITDDVSS